MSNLRVVNVSPGEEDQMTQDQAADLLNDAALTTPEPAPRDPFRSSTTSPIPPSIFDIPEQAERLAEDPSALNTSVDSEEPDDYNLKPPLPAVARNSNSEMLVKFFSAEHLDVILGHRSLAQKLHLFLRQHRPQYVETLKQYVEVRKAVVAIKYANAIAGRMSTGHVAATLDMQFEVWTKPIVEELLEEALPQYLTHCLASLVTDTLVKEITGNSAPIMQGLIPGLAEVYCMTDPSLPDNPIVYASDGFFNITQYSPQYVIGRNCRFLQGPHTSHATVQRLIETLAKGEESCETIVNYRRDGTAFLNLLMISPMYDNRGQVRYFLGCQTDVTSLVEDGHGVESFARLVSQERSDGHFPAHRAPKHALSELAQLLSHEEMELFHTQARRKSPFSPAPPSGRSSMVLRPSSVHFPTSRVVLGTDEAARDLPLWPSFGSSQPAYSPGVYQNWMLIRPWPSLRVTFTSPALRIPGLNQTKLLDRIGGSGHIRDELEEAFAQGTCVTAKVSWLTSGSSLDVAKPRWIHCTPLFGSDDRIGAWMVIMVQDERVTGSLKRDGTAAAVPDVTRFTSSKLYADYLRRVGRPTTQEMQQAMRMTSAMREQQEADEHFRDF